jgi:dimethylhistidine N-methyltransferase
MNHHIDQEFLSDVIDGLSQPAKRLSCKYFYDELGSQLFDQICELDEYYLTRTEQAIMDRHSKEMAAQLAEGVMLVEFGSGSSTKTHVLLENLIKPSAYVPVDISEDHLLKTAVGLRKKFPQIEVLPVVADFTKSFELPEPTIEPSHAAIYFPGSTIGNFEPVEARRLLSNIEMLLGHDGGLLIGIDLQKEPSIIHAAYNDAEGITDQFNLNILNRINTELDANFDVEQFEHLAFYNQPLGRVELYLVSCRDQAVKVGDRTFEFSEGERIFTEFSHKYTIEGFAALAGEAGFSLHQDWTDPQQLFAVLHLVHEE